MEVQVMVNRLRGRRHGLVRGVIVARRPLCPDCAAVYVTTLGVEMDHEIPLHLGGDNRVSNLRMLCAEHHRKKTDRENDQRRGHARGCDANGEPLTAHASWDAELDKNGKS